MATRSRTEGRSSSRRLGRAFFRRPTRRVARELLGTRLRVRDGEVTREARIVETEAYLRGDPASHAFRGRTRRNRSMFTVPGTLYVFRVHQVVCANLVTRRGEAVLLRAAEMEGLGSRAASGPGRLCRALGVSIADDGADAAHGPRFSVWSRVGPRPRVRTGPRVGVSRAAERPLRYWIADDPAVSPFRASTA
jgi:DNA-3-methyladenine glycosylase